MLYHYTSVRLLEKIIAEGRLRPSNARGWRLLWTTSVETPDPTASFVREDRVARFTLDRRDFEPWIDVRSRYQQEEMREMAERIEHRVRLWHDANPENLYVRYAALPAERWLRIDTIQGLIPDNLGPATIGDVLADLRYLCQSDEEEDYATWGIEP